MTIKELQAINDALMTLGNLVASKGHTWTGDERRLWERAERIVRKAMEATAPTP